MLRLLTSALVEKQSPSVERPERGLRPAIVALGCTGPVGQMGACIAWVVGLWVEDFRGF